MGKKKAFIITDGTKPVRSIALFIKESLVDYKVKICPAKRFNGNDLLPADIFFIGCKRQKPKSFSFLEEMLAHINLASKKCGVFSLNEKSLNYLRGILADSEADLIQPQIFSEEKIEKIAVNKWVNKLL